MRDKKRKKKIILNKNFKNTFKKNDIVSLKNNGEHP